MVTVNSCGCLSLKTGAKTVAVVSLVYCLVMTAVYTNMLAGTSRDIIMEDNKSPGEHTTLDDSETVKESSLGHVDTQSRGKRSSMGENSSKQSIPEDTSPLPFDHSKLKKSEEASYSKSGDANEVNADSKTVNEGNNNVEEGSEDTSEGSGDNDDKELLKSEDVAGEGSGDYDDKVTKSSPEEEIQDSNDDNVGTNIEEGSVEGSTESRGQPENEVIIVDGSLDSATATSASLNTVYAGIVFSFFGIINSSLLLVGVKKGWESVMIWWLGWEVIMVIFHVVELSFSVHQGEAIGTLYFIVIVVEVYFCIIIASYRRAVVEARGYHVQGHSSYQELKTMESVNEEFAV